MPRKSTVEQLPKGASILSEKEMITIERAHPDGLTSAQILRIFQSRGARLSEATFRKYVQLGLLPRCKRVGVKGKHKGSHGVYPCTVVRRINAIKRMMANNYTIEEIQRTLSNRKREIEAVEAELEELFRGFERELVKPHFDHARRRTLGQEIDEARQVAADLIRRVVQLETNITWPDKEMHVAGGRGLAKASVRRR